MLRSLIPLELFIALRRRMMLSAKRYFFTELFPIENNLTAWNADQGQEDLSFDQICQHCNDRDEIRGRFDNSGVLKQGTDGTSMLTPSRPR